jgi:hypothetical protein
MWYRAEGRSEYESWLEIPPDEVLCNSLPEIRIGMEAEEYLEDMESWEPKKLLKNICKKIERGKY